MVKKRKIAVLLILLGIGIPLVLFFFQEGGIVFRFDKIKFVSRMLTESEVKTLEQMPTYAKLVQDIETSKKTLFSGLALIKLLEKPVQSETLQQSLGQLKAEEIKIAEEKPKALAIISDIEAIFGKGHFRKEEWVIHTTRIYEIPYRQLLGIGVLLIFAGASLLVFSYLFQGKKKK